MKLRNKKTGEMGWLYCDHIVPKKMTVFSEDKDLSANHWDYTSLTELSEEWEDAPEEPKKYWFINPCGEVVSFYEEDENPADTKASKEIGNYFDTREEAEKAVEELKAFANLRKRGLKFNGWDEADRGMVGEFAIYCDALELDGIERELEIVFGREEL